MNKETGLNPKINPANEKKRRTSINAGDVAEMPSSIVTITHPEYQNALCFNTMSESKTINRAHLGSIALPEGMEKADMQSLDLRIEKDMLLMGDTIVVEADFRQLMTDEKVVDLNIHMLSAIFSILYLNLFRAWQSGEAPSDIKDFSVDIYIPSLMRFITNGRSYSENQRLAVINSLKEFHNIFGVIKRESGRFNDRYALLVMNNEKESTNTLHISSPYMLELLKILKEPRINVNSTKSRKAVRKDKAIPNYSYLVKGSIVTTRCRRAAEIVDIVVRIIEQCGGSYTPNVSPRTIINRCPLLQAALSKCANNAERNKLLKKTFKAAWRYLQEHTYLASEYIDFRFPTEIPNMRNLNKVIYFKHSGRNKKASVSEYDDSS